MKKGLTEIVFILDRSGSMGGLESDTIGGFNAMMEKQKKTDGEAYVTTVLFDDRCTTLHDRLPIDRVPRMTDEDYCVRGCTALLDALGGTIHRISKEQKKLEAEERPEKTLFIITTDGMENASVTYGYDKVKKMVERKQKKHGWEFLFIGANIDAIETAGKFGIRRDRAVDYICDEEGTAEVFACMSDVVCGVRQASAAQCPEAFRAWDAGIRADYEMRSGKAKA